ncbi:MAG TPA: hypothetical protein VF384_09615 [Planctomycetota bacterium]
MLRGDHATRIVALGFWASLLATVCYIATFASAFPHDDDWEVLPFTLGLPQYFPVTWDWLWRPHNEHRILLPRLLWIGVVKVFGADPRVLIWLDVALLALTAAVFLRVARNIRGRTAVTDVVIPLSLLGLGQYCNTLWAFQVMWFLPILLFAVSALAMTRQMTAGSAILAVACTIPMTLCGGPGLLLGAPILAWSFARAAWLWFAPAESGQRQRGGAIAVFALALASLACIVLYLRGLGRSTDSGPLQPWLVLQGCVEFLSVAVGPADGAAMPVVGDVLAGIVVGAAAVLCAVGWRREHRRTAAGVAAVLGGVVLLATAISWGRGPRTLGAGWLPRYTLPASLFFPAVQLALAVAVQGRRRWPAQALSIGMLALLAWRIPANAQQAIRHGQETTNAYRALEADIRGGVPAMTLARRHYASIFNWPKEVPRVALYLQMMDYADFGPFRDPAVTLDLTPEPSVAQTVELRPVTVVEATFADGRGVGTGGDSQLWFRLPAPVRAAEVKLQIAVLPDQGPDVTCEIFWTRAEDSVATWDHAVEFRLASREEPQSVVVSLGGHEMNWLRIDPANTTCRFRIDAITLMVLR